MKTTPFLPLTASELGIPERPLGNHADEWDWDDYMGKQPKYDFSNGPNIDALNAIRKDMVRLQIHRLRCAIHRSRSFSPA